MQGAGKAERGKRPARTRERRDGDGRWQGRNRIDRPSHYATRTIEFAAPLRTPGSTPEAAPCKSMIHRKPCARARILRGRCGGSQTTSHQYPRSSPLRLLSRSLRQPDARQGHRRVARRSGRRGFLLAVARLERQPVSRSPVRDAQVHRRECSSRFERLARARAFLRPSFAWYNDEDRHSAIGSVTRAAVHFGRACALQARRAKLLAAAYLAHPARFKGRVPMPPKLPAIVGINLPPHITRQTAHDLTATPALLTKERLNE